MFKYTAGIPSSTIVKSALLFPLFIAGGELTDRSHMAMIRSRLELMLHKHHFRNISEGTVDYFEMDWKDVIDQHEEVLLLT